MSRKLKNIIMIFVLVSLLTLNVLTIFMAKSSNSVINNQNQVMRNRNFNGDMKNDRMMPRRNNESDSGENMQPDMPTPPSDNNSDMPTPPSNNGQNERRGNRQNSNKDNDIVKQRIVFDKDSDENNQVNTDSDDTTNKDEKPNNTDDSNNKNNQITSTDSTNNKTKVKNNNSNLIYYYIAFGIENILIGLIISYLCLSKFNKRSFKEVVKDKDLLVIFILLWAIITSSFTFIDKVLTDKVTDININENIRK